MTSLHKFLFFFGITTLTLGLLLARTLGAEECRELIQNKCVSCHFVKYICPNIEQGKGSLSWKWTVNAMIKEGLSATGQEQDRLVNCLAHPDEQVKSLCPAPK